MHAAIVKEIVSGIKKVSSTIMFARFAGDDDGMVEAVQDVQQLLELPAESDNDVVNVPLVHFDVHVKASEN